MFITKRNLSRRTVLQGDRRHRRAAAARGDGAGGHGPCEDGRGRQGAAGLHRDGARRRRQHRLRHEDEPVVAGGDRPRLRPRPERARAARVGARAHHHRQQHRPAPGRGLHHPGNRRRSLPRQRRVPDPGPSQADDGLGREGRHLHRPALRPALRPGHADSVDAAVHRAGRPGRRLRVRLLLRLHRLDQLGDADDAAADDSRPAHGVRPAVRRRRHGRRAGRAPQGGPQHPRRADGDRWAG